MDDEMVDFPKIGHNSTKDGLPFRVCPLCNINLHDLPFRNLG